MDEAQRQFIADAQELVEKLYRDLEQLRAVRLQGRQRRELAAGIFRRVHTLKGSAGSLGLRAVSNVAHEFEGVLDGLRLGRVEIDDLLLDTFEDATNVIAQALGGTSITDDPYAQALIARLNAIATTSARQGTIAGTLRSALPPEIARSLSEYDLQHAREAVREGAKLFIVSTVFAIETFDQGFREVSKLLGLSGEVIATVPGERAAADEISFKLLYAAELVSQEVVHRASALGRLEVSEIKLEPSAPTPKVPVELAATRTLAAPSATVRVELDQLDELISHASELFRDTTNALGSLRRPDNKDAIDSATKHLRRRFVELEERLIKLRLVPLAEILQRAAARAGRIAARQLEKEVEFEIVGGEVGIDKSLADTISEPLLHLVRNAVGHGIETPEERIAAGKSATGKVKLSAFSEGSRIHISVSDDGYGIDLERIASAANGHGIANQGALTMDQCLRLIFRPGFSTTTEVSDLSGRGIGLDVVDRAMEQAGGEVRVATQPGAGTTFVMILPAALALVQCLIVRSGEQLYAIGSARATSRRSLKPEELARIASSNTIEWNGEKLPALSLRNLLAQRSEDGHSKQRDVILWEADHSRAGCDRKKNRFALTVDRIEGEHETLVRSLGRHAARWPGVAGAAELSDGRVALVLDLEELLEVQGEG